MRVSTKKINPKQLVLFNRGLQSPGQTGEQTPRRLIARTDSGFYPTYGAKARALQQAKQHLRPQTPTSGPRVHRHLPYKEHITAPWWDIAGHHPQQAVFILGNDAGIGKMLCQQ